MKKEKKDYHCCRICLDQDNEALCKVCKSPELEDICQKCDRHNDPDACLDLSRHCPRTEAEKKQTETKTE